ncbi:undecaprenyl-diphosphate phosphatase [soil metagenome]
MTLINAIILGLVQGLTEFIPVSSTAHLTLASALLGAHDPAHPERWTSFMATIQLGTLAAVFVYFAKDIRSILAAFLTQNLGSRRKPFAEQSVDARMGWFVIVGSVPIVVVGMALKKVIEGSLTKDLVLISSSMIGVAVLLWIADRIATLKRTEKDLGLMDAIVVGFAQVLALMPGSSRSGTTIMAGLFRGMTRESAARFSFLLSIPAILGAGVLEFMHEIKHISIGDGGVELLAATVTAFVSGYFSIAFLIRYLRTHRMTVFIVYRIVLGGILLALIAAGIVQP